MLGLDATGQEDAGRSLLISPNLNLLAEHEERKRLLSEPSSPRSFLSSSSGQSSPTLSGLPPPPRGPRRVVRQSMTISKGIEEWEGDKYENPYINPTPTFEEIASSPSPTRMEPDVGIDVGHTAPAPSLRSLLTAKRKRPSDSLRTVMHGPSAPAPGRSLRSLDLRRSSSSHDSFIDLYSPPATETSMEEAINRSSPAQTPKPPVPTSPKPVFSRRHRDISLPPTTNTRGTTERAELIARSRKLAKVFGETPGTEHFVQPPVKRSLDIPPQRRASDVSQYVTIAGPRRHSTPLSPDAVTFLSQPSSPHTSFINLSEDEDEDDATTSSSPPTPQNLSRRHDPSSSLTPSAIVNLPPEQRAEEERRIKRDRLAKLHRFLGSRVPANLVLGEDPFTEVPVSPRSSSADNMPSDDSPKLGWIKRRRTSSLAAIPPAWQDNLDRLKVDLDDEEKAINVRRAQKMERVFGAAPPQTMYHTRHNPSPSLPLQPSPASSFIASQDIPPAAVTKVATKKNTRPGTSESSQGLLKDFHPPPRCSSIAYTHYQHSLNSLNDIIDNDDVISIASLRDYLDSPEHPAPSPTEVLVSPAISTQDRRGSVISITSERRRSMPTTGASYVDMLSTSPGFDSFQIRRKKATKLTQFFGVDYRDVIRDVLESLETGLDHEQSRGSLNAEQVEELRQRLRNLKSKRDKTSR